MSDYKRTLVNAACALVVGCSLLFGLAAGGIHAQQPPPTTAAQDGFVPVDTLPPGDQLRAAPLLVAAYSVAWVAILLYVWSLWRRLSRVEGELAALSRRTGEPDPRGARH